MPELIKKYLLIGLGSLFLFLGVVGIFIPVLPTTPFLLLSAWCYLRSSDRLYQWLIHHKIFGFYIYNYIMYRSVLLSTKIFALVFLWFTLIFSIFLVDDWRLRVFLILVGIGVSIHLYILKTLKKDQLLKLSASSKQKRSYKL
ncbi:MAG TPA: DUF454 domain-containing protein [Firmicutes bacterium]|nr:DUF454 domain-containing protein [Bacillota bacterium]